MEHLIHHHRSQGILKSLSLAKKEVNEFFENVIVNDQDELIKKNPYTKSLSKAFRKVRDGDFPNSSISLNFSIPIPNRSARASYKTAQLQKEQAVLQHKNLEQQIMQIQPSLG